MDGKLCDCGHVAIPEGMATGYGTDSATGQTACFACCAVNERARMIATGRATLYLAGTGLQREVTDWPGRLRFHVVNYRKSARGGGFGAQREDAWFTGPDGMLWHAVVRGDMELARCRRTKRETFCGRAKSPAIVAEGGAA